LQQQMMSDSGFFLGVDGGGSRCRVRIRDRAGRFLSEAEGGASNIYQDLEAALETIIGTAREAGNAAGVKTNEVHAGLGIAGLVTSVAAERLSNIDLPFASVVADNDAYTACMGAFAGGDGGIVIAGTGSVGLALIGGTRHMVGGWGFALGDHGSGAWLGHHAVRRAALSIDGLLQPTPLIEAVLSTVGHDRLHLSQWSSEARPKDYASLAPLVFQTAMKGDVQAMTIVIEGAAAISNLGRALLARGAGRLCLIGGLSQAYPPYLDADVKAKLTSPVADPVDGAIMMSRRANGLPDYWT
jgi:glucosamine kinase